MNIILETLDKLQSAMLLNPQYALIETLFVFDPLWDDAVEVDDEGRTDVENTFIVTHRIFPHIYAEAICMAEDGVSENELYVFFLKAIENEGISMPDLKWVSGNAIPLYSRNIDIDASETESTYPDLYWLIRQFDPSEIMPPDDIRVVAGNIADSILPIHGEQWVDVRIAIHRILGSMGNSLIDIGDDGLFEMPLHWTKWNVQTALDAIREADYIEHQCGQGIQFLQTHDHAREKFISNIEQMKKAHHDNTNTTCVVEWTIDE